MTEAGEEVDITSRRWRQGPLKGPEIAASRMTSGSFFTQNGIIVQLSADTSDRNQTL